MMSLFSMNNKSEHNLFENFYAEAFNLFGNDCYLYQVDSKTRDINHDPYITYKDPVPMCLCFESNPKPILKRLNWFDEDEELPYLAYIAFKDGKYEGITITDDCLIKILADNQSMNTSPDFIITNVRGNKINPLYWTIKLVPYRAPDTVSTSVDPESDNNTDSGYHFVRR